MTISKTVEIATNNAKNTEELSPEIRLAVLQQKRQQYLEARYDAVIESKIADLLEDEQLKKNQVERLKRIQKALDLIEQEIKNLE